MSEQNDDQLERVRELTVTLKATADELATLYGPLWNERAGLRRALSAAQDAADRRLRMVDGFREHIHGNEHTGPMEGCEKCLALSREYADGC